MGNIGTYYANVALDGLFGSDHLIGVPDSWWFSMWYTEPGNDGSGQEVDPGVQHGYFRVEIPNTTTRFPAAAGAIKTITQDIDLPTPLSTDWGVVPYWALMDVEDVFDGLPVAWGRMGGISPPQLVMGSSLTIPSDTLLIKFRRTFIS